MPSTPLTNVSPGQKFAPTAATWNAFVETARIVKGSTKHFAASPDLWPERESKRMIVIQRNGIGGINENAAIIRSSGFFSAAVLDDDSSDDVQDLQDPEKNTIAQVSCRFISAVLFTGQEFVGCAQVTSFSGKANANTNSDVISSPGHTQFHATHRTGDAWNCEVDYQAVSSNSRAASASQCRVNATNRTGQTLVDGQRVIVQLDPVFGWAIIEFFCADGYVNPGSDPGIDGTGGGFPLP
jgi:hypothetical protein